MKRDLGDRLVEVLQAGGVEAAFGVPGGQTLPFYAAARRRGFGHVLMRDERAAACAADAYARLSGRVGVCDATVGPGVTNLVSGLAEAFASSIPVLAIVADVPTVWGHVRRRGVASQAMDQRPLLEPVSKWMARVERAASLADMLEQALRVAVTGRPGPVVLEIPDDVFGEEPAEASGSFGPEAFAYPRFRTAPSSADLERAASLLAAAQRPLLMTGGGVLLSGAGAEVTRLAESAGIPVVTTINGKGSIDERSPLALGVVGVFGSVRAGRALAEADTVLVLGSKFDQLSTFNWRLPGAGQQILHIDVDPEEIGRSTAVSVGIVADAREAAAALADRLKDLSLAREEVWWEGLSEEGQPLTEPDDPAVAPEAVVHGISDALESGDVLLCDASLSSGWGAQHFRVKSPGRGFVAPRGLAGIGWGCGAAVGARAALEAGQKLVCLAGDGAWAYSLSEVETAVRMQMPITYVILNNASLAWIRHTEQFRDQPLSSDFSGVDFAAVARAMGASGERVDSLGDFAPALERALDAPGPCVLDVRSSADSSPTVGMKRIRRGLEGRGRKSAYSS